MTLHLGYFECFKIKKYIYLYKEFVIFNSCQKVRALCLNFALIIMVFTDSQIVLRLDG